MRKIVACLFVSADGVLGESAEWLDMGEDLAATLGTWTAYSDTILLGRATYEEFAGVWPHRSGAMAEFMNDTQKLVVSSTLEEADWQNTLVIDGDAGIGEELARLRRAPGNDILVLGSATLVQSLLRRAMLDELVLLVAPVIKGGGRRLFAEFRGHVPLRHVATVTSDSGLASLVYQMNSRSAGCLNPHGPRPHQTRSQDTTMNTTDDPSIRELDHRVSDGIHVTLLWNSLTDRVSIAVGDEHTGEFFELQVDPEDALFAFQHPYVYSDRAWSHSVLAA